MAWIATFTGWPSRLALFGRDYSSYRAASAGMINKTTKGVIAHNREKP
ncbi:MAG: hypothetical protein ACI8S3_002370 [Alphaproteobacteria bacterium]|jgi:hypothetical protein